MPLNDVCGKAAEVRVEEDALGNVEVPANHLWGAQRRAWRRCVL